MTSTYDLRNIERMLCEDESTAELGLRVTEHQGALVVTGNVASEGRRDAAIALVRRLAPDAKVVDDIVVFGDVPAPHHAEKIS